MLSRETLKNRFSLFRSPILLSEWHKPRRRVWAKIISLLVTVTFVLPYLTWAFDNNNYPQPSHEVLFNQKPIKISKKLGTVTQSFSGQDRVVVCVQDLHCNYEVQNNIAGMIDGLAEEHGLRLVAVEGASMPINVTKLSTFPLEVVKKDTAHYLMKQGKITGAELYAATGKHKIRLEGIETQALYDDNRKNVMSFLNNESQGYIFDLRETLNELKGNIYTKALAQIDEKKLAFREGDISVLKYSVYMFDYGVRQKLDMKRYANLARYVSRRQNIFPENVDSDDLFNELDQLDRHLRRGLYTTPDQQVMDIILHRLDIIEKLVNISAAPKDLAEFRENPEGFKVGSFLKFIRRHDNEGLFMLDAEVYKLDSYLEEVRAFYRVADERSLAFVENIIAGMDKHQTRIAMLVTGGYHSEEVLGELKRRGVSYVSVKPCLRHQDIVNPYFALLKNRRTPLEKLLAQNQNILSLATVFPQTHNPYRLLDTESLFSQMLDIINNGGTVQAGIKDGNRTIAALKVYFAKWMGKYPLYNAKIQPDWDTAVRSMRTNTFIVPFPALNMSLVVRPERRSAELDLAVHRQVIHGWEVAMVDDVSLANVRNRLLAGGSRIVQGAMVKVALNNVLVQAAPIGGSMVILAAPSLISRVQNFSLTGVIDGLGQNFPQLLPNNPAGLLQQGRELFGTGWERAVKTLKPVRFYLLGGAVVTAGLVLVFLEVLPLATMSLFFIAGAIIFMINLNKPLGLQGRPEIAIFPVGMAGMAVFAAVIGKLFGVETGLEPEAMAAFMLAVVHQNIQLPGVAWNSLRTNLKSYLNKSLTRMASILLPFLVLMWVPSGDTKGNVLELEKIIIDEEKTALKIIEIIVREIAENGQLESVYDRVFPDDEKKKEVYRNIYELAQTDKEVKDISKISEMEHIKNLYVVSETRQNINAFFEEVVAAVAQSIKTRNKFISNEGVGKNDYDDIKSGVKDIIEAEKEERKISRETAGELEENEELLNALLKAGLWDLFLKQKNAVAEGGKLDPRMKKEIADSMKWGAASVLELEELEALPEGWEWTFIKGASAAAEKKAGGAAERQEKPVAKVPPGLEKIVLTTNDLGIVEAALMNVLDKVTVVVRKKEISLSFYIPKNENNHFADLIISCQNTLDDMLEDDKFVQFHKKYNPENDVLTRKFIMGQFKGVVLEAKRLKQRGIQSGAKSQELPDLPRPKTEETVDSFRLTETDIDEFIKQARLQRSIIAFNQENSEHLEIFLSPESIAKYFELGLNREVSGAEESKLKAAILRICRGKFGESLDIQPPASTRITIALISASRHLLRIKRIKASVEEMADSITEPAVETEEMKLSYRDVESAIMEIDGQDNQYKAICAAMNDKGIAHFIQLIRNNSGNIKKILKSNLIFGLIVSCGKDARYQPYEEWLEKSRTVKEFLEAVRVKAKENYQQRVEQERAELLELQQGIKDEKILNADELLRLLELQKAHPDMEQVDVAGLISSVSQADIQAAEDVGFTKGVKAVRELQNKLAIAVQQGNSLKQLVYEKQANGEVIAIIQKAHGDMEYVRKVLKANGEDSKYSEFEQRLAAIYAKDQKFKGEMEAERQIVESVKTCMDATKGFMPCAINHYNREFKPTESEAIGEQTFEDYWRFIRSSDPALAQAIDNEKERYIALWKVLEKANGLVALACELPELKTLNLEIGKARSMIQEFQGFHPGFDNFMRTEQKINGFAREALENNYYLEPLAMAAFTQKVNRWTKIDESQLEAVTNPGEVSQRFKNIYQSHNAEYEQFNKTRAAEQLKNNLLRKAMIENRFQNHFVLQSSEGMQSKAVNFAERLEKILLADERFAERMRLTRELDRNIQRAFAELCFDEKKLKEKLSPEIESQITRLRDIFLPEEAKDRTAQAETEISLAEEAVAIIKQLENMNSKYAEMVLDKRRKYNRVEKQVLQTNGNIAQAAESIEEMTTEVVAVYFERLCAVYPEYAEKVEAAALAYQKRREEVDLSYGVIKENRTLMETLFGGIITREGIAYPALAGLIAGYTEDEMTKGKIADLEQITLKQITLTENELFPLTIADLKNLTSKVKSWEAIGENLSAKTESAELDMLHMLVYAYLVTNADKTFMLKRLYAIENADMEREKRINRMIEYARAHDVLERKTQISLTQDARKNLLGFLSGDSSVTAEMKAMLDWRLKAEAKEEIPKIPKPSKPVQRLARPRQKSADYRITIDPGKMKEHTPSPFSGKVMKQMRSGESSSYITAEEESRALAVHDVFENMFEVLRNEEVGFSQSVARDILDEMNVPGFYENKKDLDIVERFHNDQLKQRENRSLESIEDLIYTIFNENQKLKDQNYPEDKLELFQRALTRLSAEEIIKREKAGQTERIRKIVLERKPQDGISVPFSLDDIQEYQPSALTRKIIRQMQAGEAGSRMLTDLDESTGELLYHLRDMMRKAGFSESFATELIYSLNVEAFQEMKADIDVIRQDMETPRAMTDQAQPLTQTQNLFYYFYKEYEKLNEYITQKKLKEDTRMTLYRALLQLDANKIIRKYEEHEEQGENEMDAFILSRYTLDQLPKMSGEIIGQIAHLFYALGDESKPQGKWLEDTAEILRLKKKLKIETKNLEGLKEKKGQANIDKAKNKINKDINSREQKLAKAMQESHGVVKDRMKLGNIIRGHLEGYDFPEEFQIIIAAAWCHTNKFIEIHGAESQGTPLKFPVNIRRKQISPDKQLNIMESIDKNNYFLVWMGFNLMLQDVSEEDFPQAFQAIVLDGVDIKSVKDYMEKGRKMFGHVFTLNEMRETQPSTKTLEILAGMRDAGPASQEITVSDEVLEVLGYILENIKKHKWSRFPEETARLLIRELNLSQLEKLENVKRIEKLKKQPAALQETKIPQIVNIIYSLLRENEELKTHFQGDKLDLYQQALLLYSAEEIIELNKAKKNAEISDKLMSYHWNLLSPEAKEVVKEMAGKLKAGQDSRKAGRSSSPGLDQQGLVDGLKTVGLSRKVAAIIVNAAVNSQRFIDIQKKISLAQGSSEKDQILNQALDYFVTLDGIIKGMGTPQTKDNIKNIIDKMAGKVEELAEVDSDASQNIGTMSIFDIIYDVVKYIEFSGSSWRQYLESIFNQGQIVNQDVLNDIGPEWGGYEDAIREMMSRGRIREASKDILPEDKHNWIAALNVAMKDNKPQSEQELVLELSKTYARGIGGDITEADLSAEIFSRYYILLNPLVLNLPPPIQAFCLIHEVEEVRIKSKLLAQLVLQPIASGKDAPASDEEIANIVQSAHKESQEIIKSHLEKQNKSHEKFEHEVAKAFFERKPFVVQDIIDGKIPLSSMVRHAVMLGFIKDGGIGKDDPQGWGKIIKMIEMKAEMKKLTRRQVVEQGMTMAQLFGESGWEKLNQDYAYLRVLDYAEAQEMTYLDAHWAALAKSVGMKQNGILPLDCEPCAPAQDEIRADPENWFSLTDKSGQEIKIHYQFNRRSESAESKGTLVFLHGLGGNLDYWHQTLEYYQKRGFNILTVDFKGFGKSRLKGYDYEKKPLDFEDLADEVYQLIESLQQSHKLIPSEKIHLIGHSIGGNIAAILSDKYFNKDTNPNLIFKDAWTSKLSEKGLNEIRETYTQFAKYAFVVKILLAVGYVPVVGTILYAGIFWWKFKPFFFRNKIRSVKSLKTIIRGFLSADPQIVSQVCNYLEETSKEDNIELIKQAAKKGIRVSAIAGESDVETSPEEDYEISAEDEGREILAAANVPADEVGKRLQIIPGAKHVGVLENFQGFKNALNEILGLEADTEAAPPKFSLKNIFIMGLGFLTLVYTYLHLQAEMSVSLLSVNVGFLVVLLLSVILPKRILLPEIRLFEPSAEPMALNFSVVMRILWEAGWYDSNQHEARQRLIYLLKSLNNRDPDQQAGEMIQYWKDRRDKFDPGSHKNLDLIIAYWEGKLNVPDLIAYWGEELSERFVLRLISIDQGMDVEKAYDAIIAKFTDRITGATSEEKRKLMLAISEICQQWNEINEKITKELKSAGYKLPGEIEIKTEPNIPQIDLENAEDVGALIKILVEFFPGLNTALTPEGNIQATPPDGRYPYEYPRDKAQILMNLMEIISLIEKLESDETKREQEKKRLLNIVGKCLEYTLSLQNENGGWAQRYDTKGKEASYKANQLDGNGLILQSLLEYLQRLDKDAQIGFITAHREKIHKAAEFMLGFYNEERGMIYSVNALHEWGPYERGYDVWTNSLVIAGLRAAAYMFEMAGEKEPAAKWNALADQIKNTMLEELWDDGGNSLVRVTDEFRTIKGPDVAMMAPYLFGILQPDDPKMRGTATLIHKGLCNKFWGGLDRYPLEQAIHGTRDNMGWGLWLNYTGQQAQYLFDLLESGAQSPEVVKEKILEFLAVFKAYSKAGRVPEHITIPEFLDNWVERASAVKRLTPNTDRNIAVQQAIELMEKSGDAHATITPDLIWARAEVSEAIAKLFGSDMVDLTGPQIEKLLLDLYAGIDELEEKLGTGTKTGPILLISKQLRLVPKRVMPIIQRTVNVAIALGGIAYLTQLKLVHEASATTGILPLAASDGILVIPFTAIFSSLIVIGVVIAGYKLVSRIMRQRQTALDISVPDQPQAAASPAATTPMDTEGLIEGTMSPNVPYKIDISWIFQRSPRLHRVMIFLGAQVINRLAPDEEVDITKVNANVRIQSLLARALMSNTEEINYAKGVGLGVSGNLLGGYTTNHLGGIATIKIPGSVLAMLSQGPETGLPARIAEALFIHIVKYQVARYNALVRAREDVQDLLVELETTEANKQNELALAALPKNLLGNNVLGNKDGKVALTAAMLLEALLAMLPDRENVQTQAKDAINEVLHKGGGKLTLKGLLQASLSEKTAKVPMLAAIKGLVQATARGTEDATLISLVISLIKVKGRVNTAGPVAKDPNIKTVELSGKMPQDTAAIMLDLISKASQSDEVDQDLLTALENAVKALQSEAAGGMITELPVEDGRLLASFIQQARRSAPTYSYLGRTSERLFFHADIIGYEVIKSNNVEVSVPVVVAANTKKKVVNLAQIVTQDKIPDGMRLDVFTHGKRVPGQLEASSQMQKRIAWTMKQLVRILPQAAQSYMNRKAANLSPERGLLNLIQNLEKSGLMTASTAHDLVSIRTDADALAFLNLNEPLSIVLRGMATAANGKVFAAALAEAADCMAKRISPDTLGEVTTKVESNTAEDMLNMLFFSEFFSQMSSGKLMAIAEVDASDNMWKNQLFTGLDLQARKIMVPKAMLTVPGHKAEFGAFADTLETLPVTMDYAKLRQLLKRCLRTSDGSA